MARFDGSHKGEGRDGERRRRLEQDAHFFETHYHSVVEQRAITGVWQPYHDLESERRLTAGPFHHHVLQ